MSPLERALRERIAAEGAISLEAFMEACNAYYYATRDPFGAGGDFTTAPEISQMFGELVGAALADCWRRAGAPSKAIYVELGPGRGTLAADALRVMQAAGFSGGVHFVETSPVLREIARKLHPAAHWHESMLTLPPGVPFLLVANEFFDALPIRQFIGGRERRVVLTPAGLAFDRDGEVVEDSPARDGLARQLGAEIDSRSGVAILIDYGHEKSGSGDTLQAVRRHAFAGVLHAPGEQDLTSHVDFAALAREVRVGSVQATRAATQGDWLMRLGIEVRANALSRANPARAAEVEAALSRLTSPDQMGRLFKVLAVHSANWPSPAGFA